MRSTTVETLAWVLIFSGLLLACLGLFAMSSDVRMGRALLFFGGTEAAIGAALVWWRSRMRE